MGSEIINSIGQVDNLIVAQLINKFLTFFGGGIRNSVQCSQKPTNGVYPEADESIPQTYTLFNTNFIMLLSMSRSPK